MERLRSSTIAAGQFDISYWSFSKSCIKQALSVLDPQMEEQALKMFSSILVYCGLEEPGESVLEFLWNFWNVCISLRVFYYNFSFCGCQKCIISVPLVFTLIYIFECFFENSFFPFTFHFKGMVSLWLYPILSLIFLIIQGIFIFIYQCIAAKPFHIGSIFDSGNQKLPW